jgi:hypothetical protein
VAGWLAKRPLKADSGRIDPSFILSLSNFFLFHSFILVQSLYFVQVSRYLTPSPLKLSAFSITLIRSSQAHLHSIQPLSIITSTSFMESYKVTVAQYGHPQLRGAWHYSILVYNQPSKTHSATAYQVKGGEKARTFIYNGPEPVKPRESKTFQGEIVVGYIGANEQASEHFSRVLQLVEVINGDPNWNCQSWVADSLSTLARMGLTITPYSHQALVSAMENAE